MKIRCNNVCKYLVWGLAHGPCSVNMIPALVGPGELVNNNVQDLPLWSNQIRWEAEKDVGC